MKAAVPRFPGHHQPLQPTWGYFNESDPKWSTREIDLAAGNGMVSTPVEAALLKDAGFRSMCRYNVTTAKKVRPDGTEDYADVMEVHRQHWATMLAVPLVNLPVVTQGWDVTPRCVREVSLSRPRPGGRNIPTCRWSSGTHPSGLNSCCGMRTISSGAIRGSPSPCWSMPGTNGRRAASCCPRRSLDRPTWKPLAGSLAGPPLEDRRRSGEETASSQFSRSRRDLAYADKPMLLLRTHKSA